MTGNSIHSPLRKTPLPISTLTGDFLVSEHTVQDVVGTLRQQSHQGPSSGGNEGLVFLAGWRSETLAFYSTVIVPRVRNDFASVFVDAGDFGRCAKQARNAGLQILGQVHSCNESIFCSL